MQFSFTYFNNFNTSKHPYAFIYELTEELMHYID